MVSARQHIYQLASLLYTIDVMEHNIIEDHEYVAAYMYTLGTYYIENNIEIFITPTLTTWY